MSVVTSVNEKYEKVIGSIIKAKEINFPLDVESLEVGTHHLTLLDFYELEDYLYFVTEKGILKVSLIQAGNPIRQYLGYNSSIKLMMLGYIDLVIYNSENYTSFTTTINDKFFEEV